MIVKLKPMITFEDEKENATFLECLNALKKACAEIPDCDMCPFAEFCKENLTSSIADFFSNLADAIQDFKE